MSARITRTVPLAALLFAGALIAAGLLAAPSLAAEAEHARLPADVTPKFQAIYLDLNAEKPEYTGRVRVELEVRRPTRAIRFHAQEMDLRAITLRGTAGTTALTAAPEAEGIVAAAAPHEIQPGSYVLSVEFANDFDRRAASLYRLEHQGDWYAFTQFEAIDARKAFPCWDEPAFKFPYEITLRLPEAHQGISNTKAHTETVENGFRTIVFAKTKPLPSYLLAIATGPLESVPITGLRVPGRVVTPKGQTHLAAYAARTTPAIFDAVEKYFGTPYPYEKLDLIAVPEYGPGAMENPGAITYADRFLLFDEASLSVTRRRTFVTFTAHEIAHMWFGDLVTMKWWDDLWLNEAFAEWMGNKIADRVQPELLVRLRALTEAEEAFALDAQIAARAIRQPVTRVENLYEAADPLTYKKGQTVLGMVERWLGPQTFRKGVIAYLAKHAWGNAEASDLWGALGAASGKDVHGILASFLDQPGVPLVHVELRDRGRVALSQRRFLHHGVSPPKPQLWKIPITLSWESAPGGKRESMSVLLDRDSMLVTLPGGRSPAWIHPNQDEVGYYRWSMDAAGLDRLTAAFRTLTDRERIGFIQNAGALLDAGVLHGDQYLHVLAGASSESNPLVVTALANGVRSVRENFVTEESEAAFAAYVRRVLGPVLRRYGLDKKPGEDEAVSIARPALYTLLAEDGQDEEVLARAEALARSFLEDRASVDPSLTATVLSLSGIRGDAALFEEYRRRFEQVDVPTDREPLLEALGSFREPALRRRALDYVLTGPLRPQEIFNIPFQMARTDRFRDEVWAWWRDNYASAVKRMVPEYTMYVVFGAGGCSERRLSEAEPFFAAPEHSAPGTRTMFAKMAEGVRTCAGLRSREGDLVSRTLARLSQSN